MKKYTIGIDSGSVMCKAALLQDGQLRLTKTCKTSWQPQKTALELAESILETQHIAKKECCIVSTGYGRERIDFADKTLTEITAHALGGMSLEPKIQGVIDIGGQDSKVIKLANHKVDTFLMNDKCAAGTGKFLEMSCATLDIPVTSIDSFLTTKEFAAINSMCAVFAESELIGLLSSGIEREKILNGVIRSIASRIVNMLGKVNAGKGDVFLMTGGLSQSQVMVNALNEVTGCKVLTHRASPFAGAIGAAISGNR